MRNNFSINRKTGKDKDGDDDDINYGFPVDLSLLTDRQRKIVERTRRDFLSKFLKDQGLLEDDSDKAISPITLRCGLRKMLLVVLFEKF